MTDAPATAVFSGISDVERETGVAKETLRVWERRYGFPAPVRDANGERSYSPQDVQRLRLVKRLLDMGYRPGKIIDFSTDELAALVGKAARTPLRSGDDPELRGCLELLKAHKLHALRQRLSQAMPQMGMQRFVIELVAPLTTAVGDAWSSGEIAVFEEHLYAELLQSVMRSAIYAVTPQGASSDAAPRILLTTVPQERHGLGLLMAEALFALEGAHCVSLGVQTPLADIAEAARVQRSDVVALSFSSVLSPRAAVENVTALRRRLGATAEIWVGGSSATLARRHLGPDTVLDLPEIHGAVARWRARHGRAAA